MHPVMIVILVGFLLFAIGYTFVLAWKSVRRKEFYALHEKLRATKSSTAETIRELRAEVRELKRELAMRPYKKDN
ncbi:MAG: hypothetical protein MJE68_19215 [Proteobacteria bacterium]|nr:hypothetical protein [Pseudomonadota bacterium]